MTGIVLVAVGKIFRGAKLITYKKIKEPVTAKNAKSSAKGAKF
jgi:hypothetical protein